ncbi:MAG: ATP-binding protein [Thermodesulfobacteriota bacterium]
MKSTHLIDVVPLDLLPGLSDPGAWSRPPEPFLRWLKANSGGIMEEWVDRLSCLSPFYRKRPREELVGTVTEAFEANMEALESGRLSRIENFIDYITEKRLVAGFPLSDVQKAFELFRVIVVRRLDRTDLASHLLSIIRSVNACLSYTIHRFSDHFQHMHEAAILAHAQNLEREISIRTAELAESERRYKTLVEEINDGYFVIQEHRIVFANQAFCRMHGALLDQVIGRPFLNFVAPDCRERVMEAYHDAIAHRPLVGQLEYSRLGCAPEEAATEIKSRVVDLGHGPMIIGICRDISARVAMEAKVREHERMAYVGHLTASLSHEIRNPLSSVKLNLQILSRRLDLDGFDQRRLEIIIQQVSRLEGILRQLLDTARPLQITTAPADLAALARGCVDLLEPKAAEKSLEVIQRHPRRLPLANVDAGKVEQAVINLLLNAVEASEEGGRITIWTKAARRNDHRFLELGVRDNGPGVDPTVRPHLFTPFYTSKSRGTGLGLSNVKRIVEAHSGEVQVRSRRGRGATFLMRLPCIT